MVQSTSQAHFLRRLFQQKGQIKSYVFMFISCLTWVSGYVYGNEHNFTPTQTNLSRSIVMAVGAYIICRLMGIDIQYKSPKTWRVLIKRHILFVLQGLVIAWVQFVLPLGIVHTMASSGPIFTLIVQHFLYRHDRAHSITSMKLRACIIAFIGIILTANGKTLYSMIDSQFKFTSQFQNYVDRSNVMIIVASIILVVSMIVWSYGVLITQEAQCHSFAIVFHFAVTNLFFSSVTYLLIQQKRPLQEMYYSLLWVGVLLLIAQICFTSALNLAENMGLSTITGFMVVVVGYGISLVRYNEPLDVISLIGTALVFLGVAIVVLMKDQYKAGELDEQNEEKLAERQQE